MIMKTMLEYVIKSRNLYSDKIHYVNFGHGTDCLGVLGGGGLTAWPKPLNAGGWGSRHGTPGEDDYRIFDGDRQW